MIRSAKEHRAAARASLSGKWGDAVVLTLVYVLIMGAIPIGANEFVSYQIGNIIQLLLCPIYYGFTVAFLDSVRTGESCHIGQLLDGFREYGRVFGTIVLMYVYVFLWTLLLIVPGIIKGYSYAMTMYIMRDNPEMKYNAAIERSMAMMRGHKFDLFYLQLTFIGWGLLSLLTLGIGFLWLGPYVQTATAHFYEDVKNEYQDKLRAELA